MLITQLIDEVKTFDSVQAAAKLFARKLWPAIVAEIVASGDEDQSLRDNLAAARADADRFESELRDEIASNGSLEGKCCSLLRQLNEAQAENTRLKQELQAYRRKQQ